MIQFNENEVCQMLRALTHYRDEVTGHDDIWEIYKISPLAGPITGNTKIKLYGNGFNSSKPIETPVFVKIGFIEALNMKKSDVTNFDWDEDEILYDSNIPKYLLTEAEMYDK